LRNFACLRSASRTDLDFFFCLRLRVFVVE